jgi:glucose 1-dehydrogenase
VSPDGRVAIVTAAGQGIGRAVAHELARSGTKLALNDIDAAHADAVLQEVRALGAEAEVVVGDVSDPSVASALADLAVARFGRLDVLVSNAGHLERVGLLEMTIEQFERVFRVCVTGSFLVAQAAARAMVKLGNGGAIVFTSSYLAKQPNPLTSAYNAAKAALSQFAATIAVELASDRIRVNVVEPGWIDTPGERRMVSAAEIRVRGGMLPWGRLGRPEEVAQAIAYLASDRASYVTGTALSVDGGLGLYGAKWTPKRS